MPDLTLGVAWYENQGADAEMRGLLEALRRKIEELEGVELLGSLTKRELYREMARASLWVYPAAFPEISCISAIEAAACGTPQVASRYCALKETVADGETGLLVAGVPGSEEYARGFEEAVFSLLNNETRWKRFSAAGRARVTAHYQWSQIAKEWEEWMERELRLRVQSSGLRASSEQNPQLSTQNSEPGSIRQSISCCMIVKDAEGTLHRCL
ncbi:MAG: glycosyltransferase, partial [Armatimonadetes bacterium]|nr:glycosyltransferase [Armatimonadota bacterium]NIO97019.1 glycosyltransferase [Armatimonadota bacterium]